MVVVRSEKLTVEKLFMSAHHMPFCIPALPKSHFWSGDQIKHFVDELYQFTLNNLTDDPFWIIGLRNNKNLEISADVEYSLGSIVSVDSVFNGRMIQLIADGQQRIIILFLLLRALHSVLDWSYNHLSDTKKTKNPMEFSWLGTIPWSQDSRDTIGLTIGLLPVESLYTSLPICADLQDERSQQALADIFVSGKANSKDDNFYSESYLLLKSHCRKILAGVQCFPKRFFAFVDTVLHHTVVFSVKGLSYESSINLLDR